MKYRIISDLHSEFWDENFQKAERVVDMLLPPLDTDAESILLLAGDTGSHKRRNVYAAVIAHLCKRFPKVFDIPGNHFWYGGSSFDEMPAPFEAENYFFGDMLFAGEKVGNLVAATLWTDFDDGNPLTEAACEWGMNDYRSIKDISIDKVKATHERHKEFVRKSISPGCVVMTHHAPSFQSVHAKYRNSNINGAYTSNLEEMIIALKPALWVHGHTHEQSDYMVGTTRVICNAAGYPDQRNHNPNLVVEV